MAKAKSKKIDDEIDNELENEAEGGDEDESEEGNEGDDEGADAPAAAPQALTVPAILTYFSPSHGKQRYYVGGPEVNYKPQFSYEAADALVIKDVDHLRLALGRMYPRKVQVQPV